ncbi:hypothetical protein HSB1_26630 [Halogranum salarium B-1]|uniref:Uncharacterized protein n=1 Tax=Halogranum salarium B-1 TaxID=1210908 RepID=J3EWJ1_9EURY|nr:hypothetical protein HSB1_26630 [Halogranum salarium B-1]
MQSQDASWRWSEHRVGGCVFRFELSATDSSFVQVRHE